jgi:FkbM family methyltransferase
MKRQIKQIIRKFGYDIVQFRPDDFGRDPLEDMARLLHHDHPVVFDVGANVGQTIQRFRSQFPRCAIHSFEPSPTTFETLRQQASEIPDVRLWNCALGSTPGQMPFLENSSPLMSSFLPLGESGWGEVTKETLVNVKTIDEFCKEENIERIDILKSDTQGYDLEVFKGAEETIRANKIGLIYVEITFTEMYKNLPSLGQIYDFMRSHHFLLVSFYQIFYRNQLAGWKDALFVNESYRRASQPSCAN